MNKNYKVITINGIRGIIAAIFVVLGIISGFVISPGWVCMKAWNYFVEEGGIISQMNLCEGIMLWLIIGLTLYALNNKKTLIGFGGGYQGLSQEEITEIIKKAKPDEAEKIKANLEAFKAELQKAKDNIQSLEESEDETETEVESDCSEELKR
jgi:hypothetical protein